MYWRKENGGFVLPLSEGLSLQLFEVSNPWDNQPAILLLDSDKAEEENEAPLQLLEGCTYEYLLPVGFSFRENRDIIQHSKLDRNRGRITPGIWVGRLPLVISSGSDDEFPAAVEVRSVKTGYRSDYRIMLEDIVVWCTDLLMIHSSPVVQRFAVDHEVPSATLYQRFAFIKSLVDSVDFHNAVQRIIAMPVTVWKHTEEERDIRRAGRIGPSQLREIASRKDRIHFPLSNNIPTIPTKLTVNSKEDTVDTPENRFVKHALQEFSRFCGQICSHIESRTSNRPQIYTEAKELEEHLNEYLNHSVFHDIAPPHIVPLNSPVLQRKEGYREILRVWLMFDLAAKLSWNALDRDTYDAGKRDVASLYEYWVFFELLNIVKSVFEIEPKSIEDLLQPTTDGMGLKLRQGRHIALSGKATLYGRQLNVHLHYNRTFRHAPYPEQGSWTQQMRPDYTLSLWPEMFSEVEAERQELILHIHFDAKYKVDALQYLFKGNNIPPEPENFDSLPPEDRDAWLDSANAEKQEETSGTYKRGDLLKMHAYKDAIRRTGGAYILYPGTEKSPEWKGFHEIVPGLGAFPLSPSRGENGSEQVKEFIIRVASNFANRLSQREELSFYTYAVNRLEPGDSAVHDALPERYGSERPKPPNRMTVLIGYYQEDQYAWICEKGLYNVRFEDRISPEMAGATYLVLHHGEPVVRDIWEITGMAPEMWTRDRLLSEGYPHKPTKEEYFVYHIRKSTMPEFAGILWDVSGLPEYGHHRYSPFAVTFAEFLQNCRCR